MAEQELDNLTIIHRELQSYGGYQKSAANSFQMVVCPFHADRSPSCGVFLSYTPWRHYKLGDFHCFGCGAHGNWNKFAKQTNLQEIAEWKSVEYQVANVATREVHESLLGEDATTIRGLLRKMEAPEAQKWPEDVDWRGYSGPLLKFVNAYIANDRRNDSVAIIFPIRIGGKFKGGVRGVYERKDKQLGYITSQGSWVKSYGLLGYEAAKQLISKNRADFIVLCEGPRDALRLLAMGIPACAILGANNYSRRKAMLVVSLGVSLVYAMPDNDEGGEKMWALIKKINKSSNIPTQKLSLPKQKDSNGKLIKMDPGNMPMKIARELARFLLDKHDRFKINLFFLPPKK